MAKTALDTIETDVLIIGGGGAGCRSALEAFDNGASVTMVMKGAFGKGGASCLPGWNGGFNVPKGDTDPNDSPEEELKEILQAGEGMADEKLARIIAYETLDRLHDLEKWGLNTIIKDGDKYHQIRACFSARPRLIKTSDMGIAPSIVAVLKKQIEKRDIRVVEKVMALDLLARDRACVGALCIDKEGKYIVFKAKSTVLATGGAAAIFHSNRYPADITGDGYALGYRAGAELTNMEFIQMMIRGWHVVLGLLGPDVYNDSRERFLPKYVPKEVTAAQCFFDRSHHGPFSTRDKGRFIDIAVYKEITEGRGPVYMDFTRLTEEDLKRSVIATRGGPYNGMETALNTMKAFGSNILEKPIQVSPGAHAFNGGLRINERAETTVPGLFATVETAAGPHGADRLGGNMLAGCQVFGARAGKYAAERARNFAGLAVDKKQVDADCHTFDKQIRNQSDVAATEIETKIKDLMWNNCLTVRNQKGLEGCLSGLRRLRAEALPRLSLKHKDELFKVLAVPNMLDVAEMVSSSALERKESRGSHYREDYPDKDDRHWLKTITVKK
ncbi:MAG: FAD-binding protein [Chloroflexi bacterium]|nr:FAD-binding protein [Chloroflexota bacterium]